MSRSILAFASALILLPFSFAQEKAPTPEALKERALDTFKQSSVKDGRIVETPHLIVASTLPESKAKSLASDLEKVYVMAATGLRFDGKTKEAKLTVYIFPDLDLYRSYVRNVLKRSPDKNETSTSDVKADAPVVAMAPARGTKTANFDEIARTEIAGALLEKKAGNARLTEWMRDGFARAVAMRLDSRIAATDRAAARRLAPALGKNATGYPVVDKAWMGDKDQGALASTLMDYFTFGSGSATFTNLLSGLTPSDQNNEPGFASALMTANLKVEDLDKAWRDWLAKGSPAAK